ncbi:MAG: tripartite tricarboxylate transporter permease [Paracoccus sp. (in: a-proteobacteria)]|uniref:tripartite tricarboxylate transporter permease n=1 Tax=Paracoccus sp. TaxID=267 RepID=UPI0026DEDF65|nr:tripartite tricarboxylate transporter permease [Paracoccus sp. (in: a-proteobacteria)]MDO5614088.1 tripartite tricarboxylate transporter permease [Paracoccus sp. (in: a-proteobacteria)]
MIMDAIYQALGTVLTLNHFTYLMVGVGVGLIVGILPGLGGIVGMSLLLPFVYGMEPTSALAMLIGILPVLAISDTFASVLMGIPGSSSSQATILDGFPLAKKGQAARALSAAFTASFIGGLFGAAVLTVCVLVARPLILSFGAAELFMLTMFGLSMVGVLSGQSLAKGLVAAAAGLALGSVGSAPATGEYRMEFGTLYLMNGLPLVIVGLALFAVPEIGDLLRKNSAIAAKGSALGAGWKQGIKDTWAYRWLTLRLAGLGAMLGMIPGLGGSVVDWIAYGHVVQTAKDKSQFGKGDIRGVIAVESTTSSKEGGGLVPTLLFGIPGSGAMAIFLAGMVLIGLQPGPSMVSTNLDVTYTIVWSLALANVMGTLLCLMLAPGIARITMVRYALIAPFMVMVISFAAFQPNRSLYDLVALVGMGIIGIMLRRFGWPRPAFLIGFVLATQGERYLYQALQFSGWSFFGRPIVLIIAAIIALSIFLSLRSRGGNNKIQTEGAGTVSDAYPLWPQITFTLVLVAFFLFTIYDTYNLQLLGKVFPMGVAIVGLIASFFVLYPQITGNRTSGAVFDSEEKLSTDDDGPLTPRKYMAWLVGFVVAISLVGYFLALMVFFVAFLRIVAKSGWLQIIALTALAVAILAALTSTLNLMLPAGLLQDQFYGQLPWLLG